MLLSYSQLLTLYGQLTNNADSSNVAATSSLGKTLLNSAYRRILSAMSWDFLEVDYSFPTNAVSATNAFTFTNGSASVTVGGAAISSTIVGLYIVGSDGLPYKVTAYSHPTITLESAFLGTTTTTTSTVNFLQLAYKLPNNFKQVLAVNMDIGSTRWVIKEIPSRDMWNMLNNVSTYQGTYPSWFYIYQNEIYIFPIQATQQYRITVTYLTGVPDLFRPDVTSTSGTLTATNGSSTATFTGTFSGITSDYSVYMPDGMWYEIESATSGVSVTFTRPYQGLTGATTQTLSFSQLPVIPNNYHDSIAFLAASDYYMMRDESSRASGFAQKANEMLAEMKADLGQKDISCVIETFNGDTIINPNLYLRSIG